MNFVDLDLFKFFISESQLSTLDFLTDSYGNFDYMYNRILLKKFFNMSY